MGSETVGRMTLKEFSARVADVRKAHPDWTAGKVGKAIRIGGRRRATAADVARVTGKSKDAYVAGKLVDLSGKTQSAPPADKTNLTGGIMMDHVRVADKKPNDSVRALIYKLPKGRGFPLAMCSEKWGVSEETIKNHAGRMECIMYVEVSTANWVQCVMHPETAADKRKKERVK